MASKPCPPNNGTGLSAQPRGVENSCDVARWVQGAGSTAAAATLTIPGFTHPVRDLFLEDVLEATGFAVGRGSRWAKRGTPQAGIQVTAST